MYEGEANAALQLLIAAAGAALAEGKSVGLISAEEDRAALASLASHARLFLRTLGSADAPEAVASKLYATLRELDATGADLILVRGFPDRGLGAAVQDRLRRAAAGRVVQAR